MPGKTSPKPKLSAAEVARRKAQSKRDRAAARAKLVALRPVDHASRELSRRQRDAVAGNGAAKSVVGRTIAFPFEHPARLPTQDPVLTAVMPNRTIQQLNLDPHAENEINVETILTQRFALFGLPGLTYGYTQTLPLTSVSLKNAQVGRYEFQLLNTASVGPLWDARVVLGGIRGSVVGHDRADINNQVEWLSGPVPIPIVGLVAANGSVHHPHGSRAPMGFEDRKSYMFLQEGDLVMFEMAVAYRPAAQTPGNVLFRACIGATRWDEAGVNNHPTDAVGVVVDTANTPITLQQFFMYHHFVTTIPGWYTFSFDEFGIETSTANLSVWNPDITSVLVRGHVVNGTGWARNTPFSATILKAEWEANRQQSGDGPVTTVLCTVVCKPWHFCSSIFFDPTLTGDPWMGTRCRNNGASILLTNISPELYKGGTFITLRFCNTGRLNFWDITDQEIGSVSGQMKGLPAANGCFSFVVPDQGREEFFEAIPYPTGTCSPHFSLSTYGAMYIHYAVVNIPVSNPGAGIDLCLTYDECLEFEDFSRRYPKNVCRLKLQDKIEALIAFQERPDWWYENPSHAATLYSWLRAAMNKTVAVGRKALPYIAPAITHHNPNLAPLIAALTALAQ